ncbi:MAG: VF530 family protein [Sulfurovum sp.]
MDNENSNNPLHGIKLQQIIEELQSEYGWELLGQFLEVRCFTHDPSINSCLKFFRKTPWARTKLENIYLKLIRKVEEDYL